MIPLCEILELLEKEEEEEEEEEAEILSIEIVSIDVFCALTFPTVIIQIHKEIMAVHLWKSKYFLFNLIVCFDYKINNNFPIN